MTWRSKKILERPEGSMHRGLYKAMGYSDYDLDRPLIGIANSWNRVVPGHYNLNQVSEFVQQGIRQAGGTPVEFGVIAACDGIAQGHAGMHYILPTRDLIANDIEMMVEAHRLDAVVMLGSCDKIVPAMLMAAARLDLPAIIVAGGPMEGGCRFDGRSSDITSLTEGFGMLKAGKISEEWVMLFSRNGQHHVLRGRSHGAFAAGKRNNSGNICRPMAGGPGIRAPNRGHGKAGNHSATDPQSKRHRKRDSPQHRHRRVDQCCAAHPGHRVRGRL